jgi:hypothetical protein
LNEGFDSRGSLSGGEDACRRERAASLGQKRGFVNKDGNQLTVFTKTHLQDVANAMRTLVERIETEVWGTPVF